jgi:hypothetical protein
MKKLIKTTGGALLAVSLVALAGCVVTSIYPYYTAKDIVTDPALAGQWAEAGETNVARKHWQFEAGTNQTYTLFVQDGDERTEFTAHLFQLKNHRFIDALPVNRADDQVPPHYLLHVRRLDGAELVMSIMSYGWLEELVKQRPKAIRHLWIDPKADEPASGRLVLTADTVELQAFVLKHLDNTNAFPEVFDLQRQ